MKSTHAIIITLLIANLAATIWFGNKPSVSVAKPELSSAMKLPEIIDKNVRDKIYDQISTNFNNQDYQALYDLFGPAAKAQFTKSYFDETMLKLTEYFHRIEGGAYSNAELLDQQGDTSYYQINYTLRLSEKSLFGTSGTLMVTLATRADEYEIYAFKIHGG